MKLEVHSDCHVSAAAAAAAAVVGPDMVAAAVVVEDLTTNVAEKWVREPAVVEFGNHDNQFHLAIRLKQLNREKNWM